MAAFWITKTDAPATGYDAAACGFGDYFYRLTSGNLFWRYEPATDTWTTLTSPAFARNNDPAMAGYNGYLYVWGGASVGGSDTELMRYNISTDTWDYSLAGMPHKQDQGGGAIINGKLYYVCGFDETSTETGRLYEYDIGGNSWATKTACPSVRHLCGVAGDEVNGKLYMVGGKIGSAGQVSSRIWTQSGDSWANGSNLSHSTDIPGSGEAIGASIYFVGGFDTATLSYSAQTLLYAFSNVASMPRAQEWCATGVVNGKIYAVGGFDGTSYKTTYELNFSINATGKSTTSGAVIGGTRDIQPADYIGQKPIGDDGYQVGGASAVDDVMVRHPRGAAFTIGSTQLGTADYELAGEPVTAVAGTGAGTETDTGAVGSISINNTSGQASETDTGIAGSKNVTHVGVVAAVTNTGIVGHPLVVSGGTLATETDTALSNLTLTYYSVYTGSVQSPFFYLGEQAIITEGLGLTTSADGTSWQKHGQISGLGGGSWESWTSSTGPISNPSLVFDGHTLFLYYCGRDGTTAAGAVGVATSTDLGLTWTEYGSNPILVKGSSGAWDDEQITYPYVMYDAADTDASKRFKMWYVARKVINPAVGYSIGYAYSSDGYSWTKDAGNPYLSPGTAGTYDDEGCISPVVLRVDATTWIMWYGGWNDAYNPAGVDRVGLCKATFSSPTGTYTKSGSNPLITLPTPYNAYNSAFHDVTATLNIGDTALHVANSGDFNVGDYFYIRGTSPDQFALAKVTSIPSGTEIDFTPALTEQYTIGGGDTAFLRKLFMGQLVPRSIFMNGTAPVLYCSVRGCFYTYSGNPAVAQQPFKPIGRMVTYTASTVNGTLAFDTTRGVMGVLGDATTVYTHDSGGTSFDRHEVDQFAVEEVLTSGSPFITVIGTQATSTATGLAGALAEAKPGALATETDTGVAGTQPANPTVLGGMATVSNTGTAGAALVVVAGLRATETDSGAIGVVLRAQTKAGSLAEEIDDGRAGTVRALLSGLRATETDRARASLDGYQVESPRLVMLSGRPTISDIGFGPDIADLQASATSAVVSPHVSKVVILNG